MGALSLLGEASCCTEQYCTTNDLCARGTPLFNQSSFTKVASTGGVVYMKATAIIMSQLELPLVAHFLNNLVRNLVSLYSITNRYIVIFSYKYIDILYL